ncbi:hypothetical protein H78_01534 [Pseudomonas protegens]|nr:hypothetical protein H78_01534 [Pseudomonas protegens]
MKSGETAGQGNGHPYVLTARQAKRAGPKLEAGPEASAERSEGMMEARQGRDAAGGSMRSTTARPAMFLGRGRPCSRGDAAWIFCGGQAAFAASVLPRRRSRGGGVAGAPSEARRGCAAGTSPGVQAPARSAAGAKSLAPGRSRKKGALPRRAAHRMAPGAISSPPSSSATARSHRVQRRRTAGRPRSAR